MLTLQCPLPADLDALAQHLRDLIADEERWIRETDAATYRAVGNIERWKSMLRQLGQRRAA
jgi:hypothetical protein